MNGPLEPARGAIRVGEVVASDEGVWVVGSQDAQSVAQALFEQVDGLVEPARGLVGAGEIAPEDEGVGVVGSQDAQLDG